MVLSAERGGIVTFARNCGDRVEQGEALAVLRDVWGDETETIRAPVAGVLLAYPIGGNQCAATGDKVAYLAHMP